MTRFVSVPALALLAALAPAAAQAQPRLPISAAQIAAAISGAGVHATAGQVALLADVVATVPSPVLQVESMQPLADRRMKVRLSCAASEQCLPFFVLVSLDQKSDAANAEMAAPLPAASAVGDSKSLVVHAGAKATLFLDGAHVHIRIAVVCLEGGAAGQTIRVASTDHRQTYTARVVDQAVLRASL